AGPLGVRVNQAVTGTGLGEDVARVLRILFELAAQLRDKDVEVVRLAVVSETPDLSENRLVGQELALVLGQEPKNVELVRGQMNTLAGDRHVLLLEVDNQLADL